MTVAAYGRLPYSITKATIPQVEQFIPATVFGGCNANVWRPTSTTEAITHLFLIPKIAVAAAIDFAVLWSTSNSSASNSATYRILYKKITLGSTAVAVGSTALDTTIAASSVVTTANALIKSPYGTIAAGTLTDGDAISLALNLNAVTGLTVDAAGTSAISVYGILVRFTPTYLD